jgi:cytochrome c oxidase assembly protein subunit 11
MSKKTSKELSLILMGGAFFMLGLSFASVPLYKIFCQTTGFGGTPQNSSAPYASRKKERKIKIIFTAHTGNGLPWSFKTRQHAMHVRLGENALAFYEAKNNASMPITAMATYNVTPDKAGYYFHKVACFCFEKQTLVSGEIMHMPVQFYVDPAIEDDPDLKDVPTITLSYTFFKYKPGMRFVNRYLN